MAKKPKVLMVEDTESLAVMYEHYLDGVELDLVIASEGLQAKQLIEADCPALVLLDLNLPDVSGQEILSWIRAQAFPCMVVIMTAHGSVDVAVDLIRAGADDFLEKPLCAERLRTTVSNSLETYRLRNMVDDIQQNLGRSQYHGFVGQSLKMQALYHSIDTVASSKATVFITGESGTGKEVCAEAIHKQGDRKDNAFIPINCGAIPRELMESELFGHVKGAFSGATSDRKGAVMLAHKGTLFLDEIGEMPLDLQTKLLRFLQNGTVQRVGGSKIEAVDVRVVCATNRDPLEEVAEGRFREDLYYRLNVVPIHLAPLRERPEDILLIAKHFLQKFSKEEDKRFKGFDQKVEKAFLNYNWPGNVRQLQNVVRNIIVLHDDDIVQHAHLPRPLNEIDSSSGGSNEISAPKNPEPPVAATTVDPVVAHLTDKKADIVIRSLAEVEREAIETAIQYVDGNIPKAAALLDVSPSTIYRKKQQWESRL